MILKKVINVLNKIQKIKDKKVKNFNNKLYKIKNYNNVMPQPEKDNIKTANHCGALVKKRIINAKITKIESSKLFKEDNIMGSYNIAINKPITLAFTPFKKRLNILMSLNFCQNGKVPMTNKKDGRNMKNKQKILNSILSMPLFKNIPK